MLRMNLVLAVIAALLAVPTWLTLRADRVAFVDYAGVPKLFEGFTPEYVTSIVLSRVVRDETGAPRRDERGEPVRDELTLVRTDVDDRSEWALGGEHPLAGVAVDGAKVRERVLVHLQAIRRDRDAVVEASASAESLVRYGLDEASATRIQAFDPSGNAVADLFRGNDASRGQVGKDVVQGYFVRTADSTDVLLYEEGYWLVDVDPSAWIEKRILRFAIDRATELTLVNRKGRMRVVCPDLQAERWEAREAPGDVGPARNTEIRALLQSLAGLQVERYAEPLPAAADELQRLLARRGLAEPWIVAEIVLEDGTRERIEVGGKVAGQNASWARVNGVPFLLVLGDWSIAPLERHPRNFFDPPR